ncbi:MAG: S8 family serine peptidase, partial [Bacteroidetes bacterium]|nr:S8 family serine peptidase [Bacteroidota bacterium]
MFRILAFIIVFIGINAGHLSAQGNQDVLVLFRQHPNWQQMRAQFDQQNLPVSSRAVQLIQELKAIATGSQHGFKAFLSGLTADAELLHTYYIINAATVRVSEENLSDLLAFPEVEAVIELKKLPVYAVKPVEKREAVSRAVGSHETGATVIGAPFMWNLGYTGLGRKLYTVDTGVWPVHPAISRQWLGNHLPQQQVWYGFDSDYPADKPDAHGTHVTGTVLGLDPGTADTIGIAFNARFMAADPIVEDVADIKPITTILEAFEFALNPDGNDQTTDDIPDVICNSWGVGDSIADGLCTAPFLLDLFTALDMAGIAVEFSAGNEGPSVSSISLPQYVTMDSLSIFTVGALDGNSQNLPIASFSSRGPTPCDVPDEWKIKPEVSAPGVDVRSSVQWDGYAFYSGTSMAGPHVAGAVLLLKEAFPTLSGREILNALYQSAIDLGETGEDNVYGKGVINLENAYNFLSLNNEPVPPLQSGFDVTISGFNLGEVVCEGTHDVRVT